MPLMSGRSQRIISKNIAEMHKGPSYAKVKRRHGKATADKMAIAAAYAKARKSKKGY